MKKWTLAIVAAAVLGGIGMYVTTSAQPQVLGCVPYVNC